jgi:hypothetical protein
MRVLLSGVVVAEGLWRWKVSRACSRMKCVHHQLAPASVLKFSDLKTQFSACTLCLIYRVSSNFSQSEPLYSEEGLLTQVMCNRDVIDTKRARRLESHASVSNVADADHPHCHAANALVEMV